MIRADPAAKIYNWQELVDLWIAKKLSFCKKNRKKRHFCVNKIPPKIELNRHVRLFFLDSRANQSATAKISESERSLPHQELSSRRCLHKHCGQHVFMFPPRWDVCSHNTGIRTTVTHRANNTVHTQTLFITFTTPQSMFLKNVYLEIHNWLGHAPFP